MEIKYLYDIDKFHLYKVDEIFSTNTYLKDNYDKFDDKSILWAIKQTNGRGRYLRLWESNDDLTFSFITKENYKNTIITPLAIVKALKKYDLNTYIKWPNDIYLDNKKLCGILIEDIYNSKFEASIVGIGINYNDHIEYDGIGLNKYLKIEKEILIKGIILEYLNLIKEDNDSIINEYINYNFVIGKNIMYKNKKYYVNGIDINGYLIISDGNDLIKVFSDEIDIKSSLL